MAAHKYMIAMAYCSVVYVTQLPLRTRRPAHTSVITPIDRPISTLALLNIIVTTVESTAGTITTTNTENKEFLSALKSLSLEEDKQKLVNKLHSKLMLLVEVGRRSNPSLNG